MCETTGIKDNKISLPEKTKEEDKTEYEKWYEAYLKDRLTTPWE